MKLKYMLAAGMMAAMTTGCNESTVVGAAFVKACICFIVNQQIYMLYGLALS